MAPAFTVVPPARRKHLIVSSTNHSAWVKRAADGRVTDSGFKKKAMKTTNQIEASAPANVRPTSVSPTQQNTLAKHCANRQLSTEAVLNCLRTLLPRHYELAEVVGKWVWLDVSPTQKPGLAGLLGTGGFHWNQRRAV